MSIITIQCRLVADESSRRQLWELMAEKNTPLINELLEQIGHHPDFETWRQKGRLPDRVVKQLAEPLKTDPRFIGQPGRFYTSAIALVKYIYKSWFALIMRLQYQLKGKIRWLEMLKSDDELVEISSITLDNLRIKAAEILAKYTPQPDSIESQQKKSKKGKKAKKSDSQPSLSTNLFNAYNNTEDIISKSAIVYLLKNGCKLTDKEEDPKELAKRRRKTEIQIQRLTEQLSARIPKGRDLTNARWLETLAIATENAPENETEAKSWQNKLLRKSATVPFPVSYRTNEDLTWFKNTKGRLCVYFNGLCEHTFQIYCDFKHLHWFQRFLADQEIKENSKNRHSASLFTLRSGTIAWQEGEGKGEPWNINHLTLYCSLDTRLWTAEGTQLVQKEKEAEIIEFLNKNQDKSDLTKNQKANIKRNESTLVKISNPFPRPSQPPYQGQGQILVGVSIGLENPATLAVVDAITKKVITYRSIRQLLGENYRLLNRQRRQKQSLSHQRQKAQRLAAGNQFGESELGQYIDRLIAKKIVVIAAAYNAGSIVLPKLGDVRQIIQSEMDALAEQKCPEYKEGQKKYAKQYRISIHQWSYGRLIECVKIQAAKIGIVIEEAKQSIRGSPQEKAKELAIAAYNSRSSD